MCDVGRDIEGGIKKLERGYEIVGVREGRTHIVIERGGGDTHTHTHSDRERWKYNGRES